MDKQDIIRMARDCRINFHQAGWPELERFAALVYAAGAKDAPAYRIGYDDGVFVEREACAKEVDFILRPGGGTMGDTIRARKNHE